MVLLIAFVSRANSDRSKTIDSLAFAARATKIKSKSIVSVDEDANSGSASLSSSMSWLNEEIEQLMSLVDKKHSYECLFEERDDLNSLLNKAEGEETPNPERIYIKSNGLGINLETWKKSRSNGLLNSR